MTTASEPAGVPLLQIDAFTSAAFAGNPAAVCLLEGQRDDSWMQAVAAEMNLSETAFVRQLSPGQEDEGASERFEIRWFTPKVEVDLCGHATLASAHALWTTGRIGLASPIHFASPRSGSLLARRRGELIELDFPARQTTSVQPPDLLLEALGVMPRYVGRTEEADLLIEVDDETTLRELEPDFARLRSVDARGIAVTARGSGAVAGQGGRSGSSGGGASRLRLEVFCSGSRHRRRSGHRVGSLFARTLLAAATEAEGHAGAADLRAWRFARGRGCR